MNIKHLRLNLWNITENRLLHFGAEFLPYSFGKDGEKVPMSKEEAKETLDRDMKHHGEIKKANRQIKLHHDKLEQKEREEAEKVMDKKLKEMEQTKTPETSQEVIVREWLKKIAQEIGLKEDSLNIGKPSEILRSPEPRESYDILFNGKSVGTVFAGTKFGKQDKDPANVDTSDPKMIRFTEEGFKARVLDFEDVIKPN